MDPQDRGVAAARKLARLSSDQKNEILLAMADELEARQDAIKEENAKDLEAGRASNLTASLLDRLELTPARIDAMLENLRQVADLPDPVGSISNMRRMPSGIEVGQMRVPLGVIGIIYTLV